MNVQINVIDAQQPEEQIYHLEASAMLMTVKPNGDWGIPIGDGFRMSYARELEAAGALNDGEMIVAC